jgi:DNA-binding transcriptional MocR family regulator
MVQYHIAGKSASAIADSIERAIDEGAFGNDGALPTIRELADTLSVSPTTVNAAYSQLRTRGRIGGNRRGGSRVIALAKVPTAGAPAIRSGLRNLVAANPDPALLPPLRPFVERTLSEGRLYGDERLHPGLRAAATARLEADGISAGAMMIASGAADACQLALLTHLVPGDKIALEDPTYPPYRQLCAELRLQIIPVAIDGRGMVPESLAKAIRAGAKALITIPRAQNPTGAALDQRRVQALVKELRSAPSLLVIEDDYVAMLTATPLFAMAGKVPRWMFVRSLAKALGPDLRVAYAAGDALTIERMQQRQALSAGWVSWILQAASAAMLTDADAQKIVKTALKTYAARRRRFARALRARGIPIDDGDGLQVWLPVDDELQVVRMLDAEGWAVDSGSRYRFNSPPAVRIVTTTLADDDIDRLADAVLRACSRTNRITP